jgi:NAD(P)-dependent dehydrogenase (short-subunit alcohol dehydrogenase family)
VRRLVQRGAAVAVPARSPQRLDELAERLDRPPALVRVSRVLAGDEDWAAAAEEAEESLGGIDAVVASLGGWWSGPAVIDTPAAEWDRVLDEGLGAHVRAARAFLPRLRTGGAYVLINGSGAEHAVPGSGPVSVSAAAQLMLARVLASESASGSEDERVRVRALIVATPVRTRSRPHGQPGWVSADDVGDAVTA